MQEELQLLLTETVNHPLKQRILPHIGMSETKPVPVSSEQCFRAAYDYILAELFPHLKIPSVFKLNPEINLVLRDIRGFFNKCSGHCATFHVILEAS